MNTFPSHHAVDEDPVSLQSCSRRRLMMMMVEHEQQRSSYSSNHSRHRSNNHNSNHNSNHNTILADATMQSNSNSSHSSVVSSASSKPAVFTEHHHLDHDHHHHHKFSKSGATTASTSLNSIRSNRSNKSSGSSKSVSRSSKKRTKLYEDVGVVVLPNSNHVSLLPPGHRVDDDGDDEPSMPSPHHSTIPAVFQPQSQRQPNRQNSSSTMRTSQSYRSASWLASRRSLLSNEESMGGSTAYELDCYNHHGSNHSSFRSLLVRPDNPVAHQIQQTVEDPPQLAAPTGQHSVALMRRR